MLFFESFYGKMSFLFFFDAKVLQIARMKPVTEDTIVTMQTAGMSHIARIILLLKTASTDNIPSSAEKAV